MMMNKFPAYPNIRMSSVDVKDVAKAHLRACERPEAAGKRFILSMDQNLRMVEMAQILDEVLKENGYDYNMKTR